MDLFENLQNLKEFSNSSEATHNELISTMSNFNNAEFNPQVGIFWYDINKDELFGIYKKDIDDIQFDDNGRKMYDKLHVDIWRQEANKAKYRNRPTRFKGNYTLIPRGRIVQYEDEHFEVMVGNWIKDYPDCRYLILDEFDLPEDNTKFVIDSHWDLDKGFSDKLF